MATIAVIASVVPHVVVLLVRAARARADAAPEPVLTAARRGGLASLAVLAVPAVLVALATYWYEPPRLLNDLPSDYSFLYGPDRPFAPSLARTNTGAAFDARSMSGSESCGRGSRQSSSPGPSESA